ncbi:hypothetical protein [Candidatus Borrarchaeum sp.]|uniref:hypothetical protein n=1 Tax=Candidatus Borrarchaeum sp. TaxID=2846742 RepID=UPI00257C0B3A|nr:hypothetical protein [Candidatus Borrarchaeum sp.]
MKRDCNISKNIEHCGCTYPCSKKGLCCECISYHKARGELPGCLFPPEVEKTYDRTIERFISCYK